MTRKKARWVVSGPHYRDRHWYVENANAVMPELTRKWFTSRAAARTYARARTSRQRAIAIQPPPGR